MAEGYGTLIQCEGAKGKEAVAKMLISEQGIDKLVLLCQKEGAEKKQPMFDYRKFLQNFREDYQVHIVTTVNQLKVIVNTKNVQGKGDKLAETFQEVMETRMNKSIEKSLEGVVTENPIADAAQYQADIEAFCTQNGLKIPVFVKISLPLNDIEADVATILGQISEGRVYLDTESDLEQALVVYVMLIHALKERESQVQYWGTKNGQPVDLTAYMVPEEEPEAPVKNITDEFVKYGRVEELAEAYADLDSPYVQGLIGAMESFEEAMQLNRPMQIQNAVEALVEKLKEEEPKEYYQLAEPLRQKFAALLEGVDTLRLIRWCADNGYVYQAMMIYEQQMPEYFFDNQIIYYDAYCEHRRGDGAYADTVLEAKKRDKATGSIKYYWLNELLWNSVTKKLFLNIDSPVSENDSDKVKCFKENFAEIKKLQATMKNAVRSENLSSQLKGMLAMIAENTYISPVLNTEHKMCNYFFNYEIAGVAGSVQKNYKELSKMLLTNRRFCEDFFGGEENRIVAYTPASFLMGKNQSDVLSKYPAWSVEDVLRSYEFLRQQAKQKTNQIVSLKEIKGALLKAVDYLENLEV